ncbi:MAG: hypothetical protein U7127_22630 [Phormidium sp.]
MNNQTNQTDKENWKKLVEQVKEAEKSFDEKVRKEFFDSLYNKKLGYFLAIFAKDDGDIDDSEYELLQWLMDDLYQTTTETEYANRITNMMR